MLQYTLVEGEHDHPDVDGWYLAFISETGENFLYHCGKFLTLNLTPSMQVRVTTLKCIILLMPSYIQGLSFLSPYRLNKV